MEQVIEENVEKMRKMVDDAEIESLERLKYRLSDAIREGSQVAPQKVGGWMGTDGSMCAMSAAVVAAKTRGYME